MPEIIFIISIAGYFILSFLFTIGVMKKFSQIKDDSKLPSATVIVAARNEEDKILRTLESLDKLEYPEGKLEILLVDDQSEDATGKIIDEFIINKPRFRKITTDKHHSKLIGKMRALTYALDQAKGEIILTTDADCDVKPEWVKTVCSYYTEDVGMVCGFTTQVANNGFSGMQAIDFIYLLTAGSGTVNLGIPISCIGNNMSYRKKAYNETGGYEKLPFSVTEDFILLNAVKKLKKYKILFPLNDNSLVTSLPCSSIKSLIRQKKRWGVGGLGVPFIGFVIMVFGFLCNLAVLLTPLFFSPVWLYLAVFKISLDFLVLFPVHRKLKITRNLKYFFHYQLYYMIYVVALPFIVLPDKKVIWKGRTY